MNETFRTLDTFDLPDYRGTGILSLHEPSGARIFHVLNEDPENMFAFVLPTYPEDSTGVAHILEHTVLSGSERFPVKDPFLQLLKSSANTFLNAMTYPDRTIYPAASPVKQDLFNLMEVYADAVFFPLLKPELFRQEGHRLEFNEAGELVRTGVVYNEMKGNYSSHDSVAAEKCFQSLFPDTLYYHDSGGDPKAIPALTYEQFTAFHRRYYHPSNARIVLYGNIPTEEYLAALDSLVLSRFQAGERPEPIRRQPHWSAPRTFDFTYPLDGVEDTTRRSSITLNWLLTPVTDTRRLIAFNLLSEILVGHAGSPLARALLDSGLGQDLSPVVGLETELAEAVFSVGLRGTDPEHREAIETIVRETLENLARDGIDPDAREAALRRLEFRNRERKSGPNGLRMLRRCVRTWLYGGGPADALNFTATIADVRAWIEGEPRVLESLIEDHLLANQHRSTVTVRPDPAQAERERREEAAELRRLAEALTKADLERIAGDARALGELQQTPDDPEVLARIPVLTLDDIPREVRTIACEEHAVDGIPVYRHDQATEGIVYLDLAFEFGLLDPATEALLNLLGATATEVGIPGVSYDRFNDQVSLRTGGLSTFVTQQTRLGDLDRMRRLFVVRVRALDRVWREGFDLVKRFLATLDFADSARLGQARDELVEEMTSAVIPSGHYFAGLRAGAALNGLLTIEEGINGVTQLNALRALAERDPALIGAQLAGITTALLDPTRMHVNLTGAAATMDAVESWLPELRSALVERITSARGELPQVHAGLDGAAVGVLTPVISTANGAPAASHEGVPPPEFLLTSASISHVALALPGARIGGPDAEAQELLAHLLRTGPLWEKIRMAGGAYGAFASSRLAEGLFSFGSYRDPHTARTLAAFGEALEEIERTIGDGDLPSAKVSMLGQELRPLAPRESGFVDFRRRLYDISDELRQQMRDELRAVDAAAVRRAAARLRASIDEGAIVVVGGSGGLEELRAISEPTVTAVGV